MLFNEKETQSSSRNSYFAVSVLIRFDVKPVKVWYVKYVTLIVEDGMSTNIYNFLCCVFVPWYRCSKYICIFIYKFKVSKDPFYIFINNYNTCMFRDNSLVWLSNKNRASFKKGFGQHFYTNIKLQKEAFIS